MQRAIRAVRPSTTTAQAGGMIGMGIHRNPLPLQVWPTPLAEASRPLHARHHHFPDINLAVEDDVTIVPQMPVGVVIGVADGLDAAATCRPELAK